MPPVTLFTAVSPSSAIFLVKLRFNPTMCCYKYFLFTASDVSVFLSLRLVLSPDGCAERTALHPAQRPSCPGTGVCVRAASLRTHLHVPLCAALPDQVGQHSACRHATYCQGRTNPLTSTMEQRSFREADTSSAGRDITLDSVLSQMNSLQILNPVSLRPILISPSYLCRSLFQGIILSTYIPGTN